MADRDPMSGKFVKGNKAATARRRATEADYLAAMHAAITPEQWQATTTKMNDLAAHGDVQAYRALAPYIAGVPTQSLNITNTEAALVAALFVQLRALDFEPMTFVTSALATLRDASNDHERIRLGDPDHNEAADGTPAS